MTHVGAALFVTQLTPEKNLKVVRETCIDPMNRKLASSSLFSLNRSKISILVWTRRTLVESTVSAFLGLTLLEIEPHLASIFLNFDDKM